MTFREPRGINNKSVSILKKVQRKAFKAPRHLRASTRRWFEQVCNDFELQSHHVMLLTLAAQAWDRCHEAREALKREGMTFRNDKTGDTKPRPEIMIERDARNAFARMMRELRLGEPPPEAPRPPPLKR